jgi:hypothetical protein
MITHDSQKGRRETINNEFVVVGLVGLAEYTNLESAIPLCGDDFANRVASITRDKTAFPVPKHIMSKSFTSSYPDGQCALNVFTQNPPSDFLYKQPVAEAGPDTRSDPKER